MYNALVKSRQLWIARWTRLSMIGSFAHNQRQRLCRSVQKLSDAPKQRTATNATNVLCPRPRGEMIRQRNVPRSKPAGWRCGWRTNQRYQIVALGQFPKCGCNVSAGSGL